MTDLPHRLRMAQATIHTRAMMDDAANELDAYAIQVVDLTQQLADERALHWACRKQWEAHLAKSAS